MVSGAGGVGPFHMARLVMGVDGEHTARAESETVNTKLAPKAWAVRMTAPRFIAYETPTEPTPK